jgi:hypothetical protein
MCAITTDRFSIFWTTLLGEKTSFLEVEHSMEKWFIQAQPFSEGFFLFCQTDRKWEVPSHLRSALRVELVVSMWYKETLPVALTPRD